MVSLFLKSMARLEKGKSKGLVNLGVAWCFEDACDCPSNTTENLVRTFFVNTVSTKESWEGCVKAKVLMAQQSFQASLSDPKAKAWATQGWFWPSTLLKIINDAEAALAGAAAPASLCQNPSIIQRSLRGNLTSCFAKPPFSAFKRGGDLVQAGEMKKTQRTLYL